MGKRDEQGCFNGWGREMSKEVLMDGGREMSKGVLMDGEER